MPEHDWHTTVDQLLGVEEGLTTREIEFIENLDRNRVWVLSDKQEAWLNRIADRVL